jgi:hypothetical protein
MRRCACDLVAVEEEDMADVDDADTGAVCAHAAPVNMASDINAGTAALRMGFFMV